MFQAKAVGWKIYKKKPKQTINKRTAIKLSSEKFWYWHGNGIRSCYYFHAPVSINRLLAGILMSSNEVPTADQTGQLPSLLESSMNLLEKKSLNRTVFQLHSVLITSSC